jgi:F-type H+-transporting ATPase subunit gamma
MEQDRCRLAGAGTCNRKRMTRRREVEQHRHSLEEVREIMNSVKTLAYMETRKLSRCMDAQQGVVSSIEAAAADLLSFYPDLLPATQDEPLVYLLVGTERGFCGDFNHALLLQLETLTQDGAAGQPMLVVIGRKLAPLLEGDARVASSINGAGVAEEVNNLLNEVVSELSTLQEKNGALTVFCLHHGHDGNIVQQKLLPPFENFPRERPEFSNPPDLNMEPRELLAELVEHQLFALLHEMLYASLMAENYARVKHLEGAVKHLDDKAEELTRQCNALRQEEIIEEIEVLLLNSDSLEAGPRR